jgi:hypothetical protein
MKKTITEILGSTYPIGNYFDQQVTASQLASWLATANKYGKDYPCGPDKECSLLENIGWHVLPGLIDCKDEEERLIFLEKSFNEILGFENYRHTREYLSHIGRSFLASYERVGEEPMTLVEFLRVYNILFILLEINQKNFTSDDLIKLDKAAQLVEI